MTATSPRMGEYFSGLTGNLNEAYALAGKARAKGLDAATEVEIPLASDVAARVEGLVGPKGVAVKIRELLKAHKTREAACFALCDSIIGGDFGALPKEEALERSVRAGLALFTEGVVSAPIEGISRVKVKQNPDSSAYAALYFAGPIRGAGGTGQAFSLLLADHSRRKLGLAEYRPTGDDVERYVEESNLYSIRTRAGQYTPTEDELRLIINSCPVCVDGEPTEDYEVSVHKAKNGEPNRVRGGVCLVLSEGLCLKSAKVLKIAKAAGLDWSWIEALVKNKDKAGTQERRVKPVSKYMDDLVGGRPVFGYPMRPGGFRLRYGRSPFCGIQAKAITSAAMEILGEFPVIGTQLKTERPGKGCIVTICDDMDGPIVLLDDGSVRQVNSLAEALSLKGRVQKILFNGDMLVNYGDFAKPNHPLVPGAWCDEWFSRILESKGVQGVNPATLSWKEALALSREKGVPLAPKHTLYWCDLSRDDLRGLVDWVCGKGRLSFEWFELEGLLLPNDEGKRFLEMLGLEHEVGERGITLKGDSAAKLAEPLGLVKNGRLDASAFDAAFAAAPEKGALALVSELLGVEVKNKAGTYIGASMGRPEKSRERAMEPPVHSLFPVGLLGGKTRDVVKAVQALKRKGEGFVEFDLNDRACPNCGAHSWKLSCPACGERTAVTAGEKQSVQQRVDLPGAFDGACNRLRYRPAQLKAVMGLISAGKVPEALEKGILRSKHDVTVFRDGTCRFDATEIPATHFKASEAGIPLEKLRELGYEADCRGKPLESGEQVLEIYPQDVIVSKHALDYLQRVSKFVDDLLVYHYGLPAFYNAEKPEDLIGSLLIAIAPHTSAGITCRIAGVSEAQGLMAHPYLHCACRRNCDSDELCFLLVMDGLLNFSLSYLPETRGGKMDAPLVLTSVLDPKEVDDEVHAMDRCWVYPLEFYEACERMASPWDVKLETVADKLGSAEQYEGFGFTHGGSISGPSRTRYVQLGDMREKLDAELDLMTAIRAVDAVDATERVINSHFFPDLYGNLRAFSKQKFRCVDCNAKYRRVPLSGKCNKCGGKLLLTISKGSVEKYLGLSKQLAEKYSLPNYLKQRIMLVEREIESIFTNEQNRQFSLADYA